MGAVAYLSVEQFIMWAVKVNVFPVLVAKCEIKCQFVHVISS